LASQLSDATLDQAKLRGAYVDPAAGRVLFKEYGEKWRVNQVQHRPSTRARVEGDLRKHLYPALGGRPLNSITRSDVQAWVTQLSQQLAPATVAVVYSFLATILKSAVADGIIAATPCHGISLPRIPVAHVEPLSADHVQAIAASMPPKHRAFVLVGAMTGLRFGELAGLTVDRVNFIRKALTVDRQWTADGFGPPKSSTSYRDIPLGEVAVRALADHLGTHPALEPEGIVFHTGARPLSRKRVYQ
jgi:integrase